ncbi:hypothetical protein [Winogradskyella forsetii]|uniref:hypothetical protein n=1 Tax=Winogradskyella forsetii TaxID=2686077 RepID=UPI0015BC0937|nr:hypothetical protein [Winogradskyella forsetii]
MKKLYTLLILTVMVFGCDNEKKELMAEYDNVAKKSDSINTVHQDMESHHSKMIEEHNKFSEELQGMEIKDSSVLENISKHGMMLERHDAILKSHKEIMEAQDNATPNFEDLSNIEISEKIDKMKAWHERMRNDHEMMKNEHEKIMQEHKSVKERLIMDAKEELK